MTERLFESAADLGGYLFRITDNGGATADRYTVVFSDGNYLTLSAGPSDPQGVSQWGERIDVAHLANCVEIGQEVDLSWGCLPENVRAHVLSRANDMWRDFLANVEACHPDAVKPSRADAGANEGGPECGGQGIYRKGGLYFINRGEGADDDLGPFDTARAVLLASLPDEHDLSGPEYYSDALGNDGGDHTDTAHPEIMARVAALEERVSGAGPLWRVHLSRVETYAIVEVRAATKEEAEEKATTVESINAANWQVSDANFIKRDDVSVGDIEEA